ncbi:TolC family protein [Chlorobium sp. N1]|uniref:TolC family protein n=1 Tax=Chlorobium sp. N1 TaxID=2491138 RepID=UPI001F6235FF|nr:TolC family protein [Chlorobium sp. N1]
MNRTLAAAMLITLAATTADWPLNRNAEARELTLREAVGSMKENSPALRSAREMVKSSDAAVQARRSGWLPRIEGTATYAYRDRVNQIQAQQFMPNDSYDARLSASMMLFDFGRTAKSVKMALAGRSAAGYREALAERDLSWATIQIFYDMLFLREAVKVQEKEIAALEKNLDVTRKRYDEGVATRFDLLTTEVRLASARNRRLDLETELRNQEVSLRRLCAVPDDEPLELNGSFALDEKGNRAATAEEQALGNRLEVKLAAEKTRAAKAEKSLAGREGMPKITGTLSWGTSNGWLPDSDPDLGTMRESTSAGVRLEVPIFTGFATAAARRGALARERAAEQERIDAEQQVRAEVRQSLNSLKTSREMIATTTLQVEQARLAAENARIRHLNGLATTLDLLDTEASLAEAELGNLRARYAFVMNTYACRKAAGEPLLQEPSTEPERP